MAKLFEFTKYSALTESDLKTVQVDLPVSGNQTEPVLSARNLNYHYDVLHKNYVDAEHKDAFTIAGVYLHNLYFEQLSPVSESNSPNGKIKEIFDKNFNGFTLFKRQFADVATGIQGSGWCYLTTDGSISTIANHETRENIALIIDMWEHAWITDYNDKARYVDNTWKLINWSVVNKRLE